MKAIFVSSCFPRFLKATLVIAAVYALIVATSSAHGSLPRGDTLQNNKPLISVDCTAWQIWPSPNFGSNTNYLNAVAVVSANDVWAVGEYYDGSQYQTLTEHWNGSTWSIIPSPGSGDNRLYGIAAVSANDVWAVGYSYNASNTYQTLTEHWNGSTWSIVSSPNPGSGNSLYVLAVVSANDMWAVGDYYNNSSGSFKTLTEHWNGSTWSIVSSPNPGSGDNILYGVAAVSTNDVWAVGYYSNGVANESQTLTEHWNGSTWSVVSSPNPGSGDNMLNGVAVVSANDVWAVGYYSNSSGVLTLAEHWNGSTWSVVSSPNPGSYDHLNGVAVVSANDVWAVGDYLDAADAGKVLTEHWDGNAWNIVPNPPSRGGDNVLNGVAAVSGTDVWAAGYYGNSPLYQTLIEHFSNPCATSSPTPLAGTPTTTACTITFNDVPQDSTFYPYIECLACKGIISGYECGGPGEPCPGAYFRPGANVTRGQAAKIVANSAGYNEQIPPTRQTFNDVPPASTFWMYIERVALHGAISGYECGGAGEPCPGAYFRPANNLTRGQLSKIDANVVGYSDSIPSSQQSFNDVPPASTFWVYIERVHLHGVISGYECGGAGEPCPGAYFRPSNQVTRGQTSKIVGNTFFPACQTP